MRHDGGHLAELRERLLFGKPLFEHDAIAQVVQNARKASFALGPHFADRQMNGKRRAVLAAAGDFAADADNLLFSGRQVVLQISVVPLAIGAGHQHVDVAPEHFADAVAEQPLGGRIERLNQSRGRRSR